MKKRKGRRADALTPAEIGANFTRGMVASGLLAAIQDRAAGEGKPASRKILRYALQGGAALAAGAAAADAIRGRRYAGAVLAMAAGAAGVLAVEQLLNPAERPDGDRPDIPAHEEPDLG